ncbi:MAG: WYL domain-containing transcriptional regulator [Thermodesulfobacteriota bacterium]
MSSMRGINLIKLMKLLDLLSRPAGASYDEMAEELNITKRSVYRLLEVLDALGFPVIDEKIKGDPRKRKKLLEDFRKKLPNMTVPEITFTNSELFALALLKNEDSVLRGTELDQALEQVFSRLEIIMPENLAVKLKKVRSLFVRKITVGKTYAGQEKIIEQLFRAILATRRCTLTYHSFSADTVKSYQADPLQFFEHNGGLYLFARVVKYGDIRILAIERIKKIETELESFDYPENFDSQSYLESAFGLTMDDEIEVKILFSADQARYIKERKWAVQQKLAIRPDGSVILWMRTSGWYDVKRWVLSFGSDAEILEPPELREGIKREIMEMGKLY